MYYKCGITYIKCISNWYWKKIIPNLESNSIRLKSFSNICDVRLSDTKEDIYTDEESFRFFADLAIFFVKK
jgi:hypothetical protein